MLIFAIVFITAALIFYTTGVWMERLQKTLKWSHVVLFGLGLVCDATGTWFMSQIMKAESFSFGEGAATFLGNAMIVTGYIAIILMAIHLAWAIWVMLKGTEKAKATFHRFSIVVWAIWLVPYFTGMAGGMMG